jgi:hypothetical protein
LARLARVKAETLSGSGRVRSDNRVKAFSLSGGGRVSQVRSGYGLGSRVMASSLSRGDRVSWVGSGWHGLSSSKAKTSSQAGFSLITQPRLG